MIPRVDSICLNVAARPVFRYHKESYRRRSSLSSPISYHVTVVSSGLHVWFKLCFFYETDAQETRPLYVPVKRAFVPVFPRSQCTVV